MKRRENTWLKNKVSVAHLELFVEHLEKLFENAVYIVITMEIVPLNTVVVQC
jgi:hypothetical protein